ncbi:hypothetical protein NQZ68_020044, partial [Dissostichus eleginoides]
ATRSGEHGEEVDHHWWPGGKESNKEEGLKVIDRAQDFKKNIPGGFERFLPEGFG